jgi:splicing factor U2AF subunit
VSLAQINLPFIYTYTQKFKLMSCRLGRGLCQYGHLTEMHVCDNVGDHLMGNVYARFEYEAEAAKAVDGLNDRWYALRPLHAELSPVSDFREACCRQNELGECKREGSVVFP